MRITLHGAAGGEVTGSAYLVQTTNANVLLDFGLFQGTREADALNAMPAGLAVDKLDAVVLTHAHLDHTGRLPLLIQQQYKGPIFATAATLEMANLILKDAAHVQLGDCERANRKRAKAGKPPLKPLYTADDVAQLPPRYRTVFYDQPYEPVPGVRVRMVEAGHMLGSTSVEMTIDDNGTKRVIVFSGDLGPRNAPVLRDPVPFKQADLVFLESTYGDRNHRPLAETIEQFRAIVKTAVAKRGKILVPIFAVGRAQLMLYCLAGAFRDGAIPPFPVYLDSPMAIEASRIYTQHTDLYDEEALALHKSGKLWQSLDMVKATPTADASKALNDVTGPVMILAGSGMCNAGRILHHLRHNLPNPATYVLIVGFQSDGSIGRQLVDGRKEINIFGDKIDVGASVHTLGGFSAHAGQTELVNWFSTLAPAKPRVALTHGEDRARDALARLLRDKFGAELILPTLEQVIEI